MSISHSRDVLVDWSKCKVRNTWKKPVTINLVMLEFHIYLSYQIVVLYSSII